MLFFWRLKKIKEEKENVTACLCDMLPRDLSCIVASYAVEENYEGFVKAILEACNCKTEELSFGAQIFIIENIIDYFFYLGEFWSQKPSFASITLSKMQHFDIFSDHLNNKNRKLIIHILENNPMLSK
jgi:hypothetical protein